MSTTSWMRRRAAVSLTEEGNELAQKLLGGQKASSLENGTNLYDPVNLETLHILAAMP